MVDDVELLYLEGSWSRSQFFFLDRDVTHLYLYSLDFVEDMAHRYINIGWYQA